VTQTDKDVRNHLGRARLDVGRIRLVGPIFGAKLADEESFGFLGRAAGLTPFQNVLFARTRGLDHLIVSAAAKIDKPLAEPHCAIEDDSGFMK
jgi:hypothetical protein